MTSPKVTIIIPAYNAGKHIRACLKSIFNQTEKSLQIIVIDDGSTDETRSILIKEQRDHSNLEIFFQDNAGVSKARNLGLVKAKGKFLSFVDSDDTLDPKFYEHLLWNQEKTNGELIECGRIDCYPTRQREVPTCKDNVVDISRKPEYINKGSLFVWDKLFITDVIRKNNITFDESIGYAEDAIFLIKYKLSITKISYVHKCLYYYRINPLSASKNNTKIHDIVPAMESLIEVIMANGRFRQMISYVGDIASGYFVRKISSKEFLKIDKKDQNKFITDFLVFFQNYIPNWKEHIVSYKARNNKWLKALNRYRTNVLSINVFLALKKSSIPIGKFINLFNTFIKFKKSYKQVDEYFECRSLPLKQKQIFLLSFFGSGFSDNIFYIAKWFSENTDFSVIVGSNYLERDLIFAKTQHLSITFVKVGSKKFHQVLAESKYLVTNSRFPSYFNKRQGQILLNTWHGTPLKTLGRSIHKGLSDLGNNQTQFLQADLILVPNEHTYRVFSDDYSLKNNFQGKLEFGGYPRNSVFFRAKDRQHYRNLLSLTNKRVFAYMPTWRGETLNSRSILDYKKTIERIFDTLDANVQDDVLIYVKLHQVVMNKININKYKHIKPFDSRFETYQFLNLMDCLVTDYSSVLFDYLNSKRKVVLFMYDYKQYIEQRGLYFELNKIGLDKLFTISELIKFINTYNSNVRNHSDLLTTFCKYDSENSTEILCRKLLTSEKEIHTCQPRHICLMPQLTTPEKVQQFKKLVNKSDILFVFAQEYFTRATESILHSYDKQIDYIVVPIKKIMPSNFYLRIRLGEKIKWITTDSFREKCRKLILPGISYSRIDNYSNYPEFRILQQG